MTREKLRAEFPKFIKEIASDALTYYPACGFDRLPKEVLGAH